MAPTSTWRWLIAVTVSASDFSLIRAFITTKDLAHVTVREKCESALTHCAFRWFSTDPVS